LLGQLGPLDGESGLAGEGLQQQALLGEGLVVGGRRPHPQDPHDAPGGLQRQVAQGSGGEGLCALPSRLAMLESPRSHRVFIRVQRQVGAGGAGPERLPLGQQHHGRALEGLAHMGDDGLQDRLRLGRRGQVPTERVQRCRLGLATPATLDLVAHLSR